MKKRIIALFAAIFAVWAFAGCEVSGAPESEKSENESGSSSKYPILDMNKWYNKEIGDKSSGGTEELWFQFTATKTTQYIFVKFSTLTQLNAYLYDSDQNLIGTGETLSGDSGTVKYFSRSNLTVGGTYFIKLKRYSGYVFSNSVDGKFWVGFNDFPARPEKDIVPLTEAEFKSGEIFSSTVGDTYEWFKFTATKTTQYIFVKFSTLTQLNAYLYDSDQSLIGTGETLSGDSGTVKYFSRTVSDGKTYFIKLERYSGYVYSNSVDGKFWVGFNSSTNTPQE